MNNPQTIREVIDSLPDLERRTLDYAFENGMSHFVRLPNGKYIGVNIAFLSYLKPTLKTGKWSYGDDESLPNKK